MKTITSTLQVIRHAIATNTALLFFVEIPLKSQPGKFFRLVRSSRHISGNGKLWQAASISIDLPSADLEGSLGQLGITLDNTSRIPLSFVEDSDDLLGQPVTVYLQAEGNLAVFEPALSWTHVILRARATERAMGIECGHPGQTVRVPMGVFDRQRFPGLLPSGDVSMAGG